MKDLHDPATVSAELEGISALVTALYVQYSELPRPNLSDETIANALFALQCHLERISDTVGDYRLGRAER